MKIKERSENIMPKTIQTNEDKYYDVLAQAYEEEKNNILYTTSDAWDSLIESSAAYQK